MQKISLMVRLAVIGALLAGVAMSQDQTFSDPAVDYTFTLPNDTWKMVQKPSATNPNVEYVYGFRTDGFLTIRKVTVTDSSNLESVIEDESQSARFKPGYVANKNEAFAGKLSGTVYNFEYAAAGKAMVGRYYFLRADPKTVYVLRFTGLKDSLRSIRPQTDSIARTFNIRK